MRELFKVFFHNGHWHVKLENGALECGSRSEAELIADLIAMDNDEDWALIHGPMQ
jgi:hypothetical protein